MVSCKCGMVFLPAFFGGKCPKCGTKFVVTEEEIKIRDASIKACQIINKELDKGKDYYCPICKQRTARYKGDGSRRCWNKECNWEGK